MYPPGVSRRGAVSAAARTRLAGRRALEQPSTPTALQHLQGLDPERVLVVNRVVVDINHYDGRVAKPRIVCRHDLVGLLLDPSQLGKNGVDRQVW